VRSKPDRHRHRRMRKEWRAPAADRALRTLPDGSVRLACGISRGAGPMMPQCHNRREYATVAGIRSPVDARCAYRRSGRPLNQAHSRVRPPAGSRRHRERCARRLGASAGAHPVHRELLKRVNPNGLRRIPCLDDLGERKRSVRRPSVYWSKRDVPNQSRRMPDPSRTGTTCRAFPARVMQARHEVSRR
jgi:hypothetical protein